MFDNKNKSINVKLEGSEILEILQNIKNKKETSISYIQRTFSFGYIKANRAYQQLMERNYISSTGKINKKAIYEALGEEYIPGLKLIFLDVDGVLNCRNTKDTIGHYIGIEDKKVSLLKELVDKANAKIVLVSSWKQWWFKDFKDRQDDMANYLDMKLATQGLSIMDKTNDYNSYNRGDGILEYLWKLKRRNIEVDNYVILDDEMFDYKQTRLTKNLVQTSFENNGLEAKHIERAVNMLC